MTSERGPMTDHELLKFAHDLVDVDPADAEPKSLAHAQAYASIVIARALLRIEARMPEVNPYPKGSLEAKEWEQK